MELREQDHFGWRLGNDEPSTHTEEWRGTLGNDGRGPEGSDDDTLECPSQEGVSSDDFSSPLYDLHPVLTSARSHSPPQEIGAALIGVQKDECCLWPLISQNKARETSARPQIQNERRRRHQGLILRQVDETSR